MQTPGPRRTEPTGESPPLTGKRLKEAMDYWKREDSGSDTGEPIEQTADNIQEAIDDITSELQKLTKKYNKKANMKISNNSNLGYIERLLNNEKNENQRKILNDIYIYMQDIETLQLALQTKPIMTPAPIMAAAAKRSAYIDLLEKKLQNSKDKLQTYKKKLRFNKRNQKRILKEIERAKKWIDKYTKTLTELYSKMPSSPSQTPRFRF